jgi:hypothetical protein
VIVQLFTFESPTSIFMNTASLRQKLHGIVDTADRSKLISLLRVGEEIPQSSSLPDSDEFRLELEKRWLEYERGETEVIPWEESQRRVKVILDSEK